MEFSDFKLMSSSHKTSTALKQNLLDVKKRHKQQLEHKNILGRWWKQTSDQSASAFKAKTDQPNKAGEMCWCKLLARKSSLQNVFVKLERRSVKYRRQKNIVTDKPLV